jgi:NarL family two-component system response regulator LiaR
MIRLAIVDDHTVLRQGLRFLFEQEPDVEVVGEAGTGTTALSMVAASCPDVLLLDLLLPDTSGLEVLAAVRQSHPQTHVVVLTSSPDDAHLLAAIHTGATSFLQKTASAADVLATVRAAARGESVVPPLEASRLLGALHAAAHREDPLDRLTPREREVLAALARGRSNREIAQDLRIGEETVKSHLSAILAKLNLADRTQAALFAVRHGVVAEERQNSRRMPPS